MTSSSLRRLARRYPGLYRATVVDVADPQGRNRLKVDVPSVTGSSAWAPMLRDLGASPQVGEEVIVGFEAGRAGRPVVLGILATGPSTSVEIADDNGNSLRLTSSGIEMNAAAEVRIQTGTVEVSTSMLRVDSAMSQFAGVVECSTLVATSVIAASYTPGAGNIW